MDDYRALENLVFSYAALVDAGNFAGVGELFAEGAFVGSGGTPRTKHVTTNLALQVSGLAASGRAYFTVLQAAPGFPLQTIAAGRYEDRFTRGKSGWRFTERRATVDLLGDVSHHLHS